MTRYLLLVPFLAACGGAVNPVDAVPSSTGGGPDQIDGGDLGGAGAGGAPFAGGNAGSAQAGADATPYVDPGCPQKTKIQGPEECDARAQTGCGSGEECAPYVDYGQDCHTETIGTQCIQAGNGLQGDDCSQPSEGCAPGFVCATSGTGLRCAALCDGTSARSGCPPGLICVDLDVDGYFVCG